MRDVIAESWVVYLKPVKGIPAWGRGICQQAEWEAMELARPGVNILIQAGITNEGVAERLARGRSGETKPRNKKAVALTWPDQATLVGPMPAAD